MYYIKKGKKVVATSDPDEVTKENFVCEPGAENKVHCKLEKYEFDRETGEKKAVTNQVRADNPGDFERFAPIWKRQGMTITMLHDPREGVEQSDVAAKLAKLNAGLNENENQNENGEETPTAEDWQKTVEAKEMAEKRAAEAEERLRLLEEKEAERAKAEEEARIAEVETKAKADAGKAEEEANAKTDGEGKETKGKTK